MGQDIPYHTLPKQQLGCQSGSERDFSRIGLGRNGVILRNFEGIKLTVGTDSAILFITAVRYGRRQ
jgi:hypothetical protein